jgi:hypothetical protein
MVVCVDEAGGQDQATRVDDARIRGNSNASARANRNNPIAFNDDDRVSQCRPARTIDQGRA